MEEEKKRKQEKQTKKFTPDFERKLDREINRKLSREFDKRLSEEVQKKFIEDRERQLTGEYRSHNNSGSNSRKTSLAGCRKISDYHTPPQFISPPASSNPSPLPLYHDNEQEFVMDDISEEQKPEIHTDKVKISSVYISLNDRVDKHYHCNLDEKGTGIGVIANGNVTVDKP